jgi:hypothetical protein
MSSEASLAIPQDLERLEPHVDCSLLPRREGFAIHYLDDRYGLQPLRGSERHCRIVRLSELSNDRQFPRLLLLLRQTAQGSPGAPRSTQLHL